MAVIELSGSRSKLLCYQNAFDTQAWTVGLIRQSNARGHVGFLTAVWAKGAVIAQCARPLAPSGRSPWAPNRLPTSRIRGRQRGDLLSSHCVGLLGMIIHSSA
jgi:hypothetical protein